MSNWLIKTEFEKDGKIGATAQPIKGQEYFVYGGAKKPTNKPNIQQFKLKTGMLKSEHMLNQVVEEIGANVKEKEKNITRRKKDELIRLNDEVANTFLKYLHNLQWMNEILDEDGNIDHGVAELSPIDLDELIKIISPAVENLAYINKYTLDMKYNPKLTASDVNMNLEKIKKTAEYGINPMKTKF